jgi:hypothetical protein
MKILRATVVIQSGHPDKVSMTTDLPSPFLCDKGTDTPLYLMFDCNRNGGVAYVKEHFGIKAEPIKVS